MRLHVIDNFLSKRECDFFRTYHDKYYGNQLNRWTESSYYTHGQTSPLVLGLSPIYHIRLGLLRKKIMRKILKLEPSLKFNYDQIVSWPTGSSQDFHVDSDPPNGKRADWTSVCYLNDDYDGGGTVLKDVPNPGFNTCEPKQGRVVIFPSKYITHGVTPIQGTRFTYIAWWQQGD